MADRYWVGGSGTWSNTGTTNWSETSGGASGASAPTSTDNVFFDDNSGTDYTVTLTTGTCNDFTLNKPASGTVTFAGVATNFVTRGNFTVGPGVTWTATSNLFFSATTSGKTITTNGTTFLNGFAFNGAAGGYTLADNLTSSSVTGALTITAGSNQLLDLNNNTITVGTVNIAGSATKTIAFGTSGAINLTGNGTTVWNNAIANGLTITGTPTVNLTYSGSTGTRTIAQGNTTPAAAANVPSFNITAGSDTVVLTAQVKDLNFTGFSGTLSNGARTIFGNLILSSGMTVSSGTAATTFGGTSVTNTITTNGKIIDFPVTFNGAGSSWQLQDDYTGGPTATSVVTLTTGTLDLNDRTVNIGLFSSSNANTRALAFGTTGVINIFGSGTTVWGCGNAAGFTYTGTPTVNFTYSSNVGTRTVAHGSSGGSFPANLPPPFNFTAGADTIATTTGGSFDSFDFTGFSGTLTNTARALYGNFILSPTMTLTSGTNPSSFTSSATQIVDTANLTIPFPLFVGSGGAGSNGVVQLANALTLTSANTLTLTSGTLTTDGYPVSTGLFNTSGNLYRVLDISNNTLDLTGTGIVFTAAISTNLTLITANSTVLLSNDTTAARIFVTGNQTYNNVVIGGNTATSNTTFTGNATFNTLSSTKTVAHTVRFTAGTTTTVDAFDITGTANNVVTITSDTANVHNLVYTGAGNVDVSWANISYSNASPANTWFALVTNNNTNSGNNTGWVFGDTPVSSSNFFLLF